MPVIFRPVFRYQLRFAIGLVLLACFARMSFDQVFAAGHSLALLNANLRDAEHVRKLVEIRPTYKQALIHGKQLYQPSTGDEAVYAYGYNGGASQIITAVNTSDGLHSG